MYFIDVNECNYSPSPCRSGCICLNTVGGYSCVRPFSRDKCRKSKQAFNLFNIAYLALEFLTRSCLKPQKIIFEL